MPDGGDAKLFKVLRRQAGKNRGAYVILPECRFVSFKTQLSQPVCDFHRRPPASSH